MSMYSIIIYLYLKLMCLCIILENIVSKASVRVCKYEEAKPQIFFVLQGTNSRRTDSVKGKLSGDRRIFTFRKLLLILVKYPLSSKKIL